MRLADKQVKAYLKSMCGLRNRHKVNKPKEFHYSCSEELLLDAGKFYRSNELTKQEREYVQKTLDSLGFMPRSKECYYNAQLMILNDYEKRLSYCEGIAYCGLIPLNHAWLTINEKVIDLTWKDGVAYVFGKFKADRSYMGITIEREEIKDKVFKKECSISFLDNWEERYPLLRKKFKGRCLMS